MPKKHIKLKNIINKNNSAVVVIDKQIAYFSPESFLVQRLSDDPEMLVNLANKIDEFIDYVRQIGVPIIWTRMIEDRIESPVNLQNKLHFSQTPSISSFTNNSADFFGRTRPIKGEVKITKYYYDAFSDNEVQQFLRTNPDINSFILVGGYTSRCVLGTAFAINAHGHNLVVLKDLVGMPDTLQNEHYSALNIIDAILGYRLNSDDLKDLL